MKLAFFFLVAAAFAACTASTSSLRDRSVHLKQSLGSRQVHATGKEETMQKKGQKYCGCVWENRRCVKSKANEDAGGVEVIGATPPDEGPVTAAVERAVPNAADEIPAEEEPVAAVKDEVEDVRACKNADAAEETSRNAAKEAAMKYAPILPSIAPLMMSPCSQASFTTMSLSETRTRKTTTHI